MPATAPRIELAPSAWLPAGQWADAPEAIRRRYLERSAELAMVRKRYEIRLGIGANGSQLPPVKPRDDGATGKPLAPHFGESRSVANLRSSVGLAGGTVTLWWTGRVHGIGFGQILLYHAQGRVRGAPARDVIGLSPAGLRKVQEEARRFWRLISGGRPAPIPAVVQMPRVAPPAPVKIPAAARRAERVPAAPLRAYAPRKKAGTAPAAIPGVPARPVPAPIAAVAKSPPSPGRTPLLPGRPIAERLAAYTDGDRKVDDIIALGVETRAARRDFREAQFRIENIPYEAKATADAADKARVKAAYDEALADRARARVALNDGLAAARTRLREIAGTAAPQAWEHAGTGVENVHVGRLVRESDEFLVGLFESHPSGQPVKLKWTARKRSGYRANYDTGKRELNLAEADSVTTAIHERGHQIEDAFPAVGHQARQFLRHRVGDEPLKHMGGGYDADEFGRDDEFARYFGETSGRYVGKDYGINGPTEILSMGLQALYEDPVKFAQQDSEYCKWVLGILDGSLR